MLKLIIPPPSGKIPTISIPGGLKMLITVEKQVHHGNIVLPCVEDCERPTDVDEVCQTIVSGVTQDRSIDQ
jgi:hypothetical protein